MPGKRETAVNGTGAMLITGHKKLAKCARSDVSVSIAPILWMTKNVTQNTFPVWGLPPLRFALWTGDLTSLSQVCTTQTTTAISPAMIRAMRT